MSKFGLPVTEELDFHYLLELMPPLHQVPEYALLPELFACIGHEKLVEVCKYMGGEVLHIPTLEELEQSIDALQWFYDIHLVKKPGKVSALVPDEIRPLYERIVEAYHARNH